MWIGIPEEQARWGGREEASSHMQPLALYNELIINTRVTDKREGRGGGSSSRDESLSQTHTHLGKALVISPPPHPPLSLLFPASPQTSSTVSYLASSSLGQRQEDGAGGRGGDGGVGRV